MTEAGPAPQTLYLWSVLLDGVARVCVWESGDEGDRVVLDERGQIVAFPSELAARQGATAWPQPLSAEEPARCDVDAIERWCHSDAMSVDCPALLNLWNLIIDVPGRSQLFDALDRESLSLYDKLFHGCNLPSMTAPGDEYVPAWMAAEVARLKRLLLLGIAELRARLPAAR